MDYAAIKETLCVVGSLICDKVHASLIHQSLDQRTAIHAEDDADTIYQLDRDIELLLVTALEERAPSLGGIRLIAEGIGEDGRSLILPRGMREDETALQIIIDPIDGTRGIMYDKRSAFFLAAATSNDQPNKRLRDIEVAVMVELPTSRSFLSDQFWAIRGQGAQCVTRDLNTGALTPRLIQPSRASSIIGGFAQISRFFPPGKEILARIEDELVRAIYPDVPAGRAILFEDQYISTGGQLYELLMGRDRFTADLRDALYKRLAREGTTCGLTCHPYDLCVHLIGEEAGIVITGVDGYPLDAPLDTTSAVDWIGYANPAIRKEVEPILQSLLQTHLFEDAQ